IPKLERSIASFKGRLLVQTILPSLSGGQRHMDGLHLSPVNLHIPVLFSNDLPKFQAWNMLKMGKTSLFYLQKLRIPGSS
ncbi:hypothetical protein C0989_009599, partial [Termitomyces sp. Mn162]